MPKIVDRERRRAQIVEAYLTVVGRDGLPAATSRAVAAELGVGTGSLWHYYDGFDDVVSAAFALAFRRTDERIATATARRRALPALYAMMREILPVETGTIAEAYVAVGYWGRLAANPALVEDGAATDGWDTLLTGFLDQAIADGTLRADSPVAGIVDVLRSIAAGQQVQAVLRSRLADPARQFTLIDQVLGPWARGSLPAHPRRDRSAR